MWRLMRVGATAAKVTCKVPHPMDSNRSFHFLSDFPHLLNCLRNTLLKAPFNTPDGKDVSLFWLCLLWHVYGQVRWSDVFRGKKNDWKLIVVQELGIVRWRRIVLASVSALVPVFLRLVVDVKLVVEDV
ncbi:hypothetical protein HPB47_015143 [Ixodes persulcatus]|uniref:Uncharacterized protein n=1 Tax=Ixodes persulcatus TaxID=34615 RepID=A0AC60QU85_IXOPE|nr:hypothetical protein HPB47_015143 [Ixodes persulcatus]